MIEDKATEKWKEKMKKLGLIVNMGADSYRKGKAYFFDEKGKDCLLRIEGVPPVKLEEGNQIDIHLVNPGGEHHHVSKPEGWGDGAICAVKLKPRK